MKKQNVLINRKTNLWKISASVDATKDNKNGNDLK
jgi:hypothetical protein